MKTLRAALIGLIYVSAPMTVLFLGFSLSLAAKALPLPVFMLGCGFGLIALLGIASLFDERGQGSGKQ